MRNKGKRADNMSGDAVARMLTAIRVWWQNYKYGDMPRPLDSYYPGHQYDAGTI